MPGQRLAPTRSSARRYAAAEEVGMDVEPLGLKTGEPADDGLELVSNLTVSE
jgi:hypothetical protein